MLKSFYSRVYRSILQHNAAETCSFSAWTELLLHMPVAHHIDSAKFGEMIAFYALAPNGGIIQ